jgi:trypsin
MNALTATTTATKTRLSQLVLLALTSLLAALALAHPAQAADTTAKQVTSGPTAGPSIIGGYYPHASQWPWMAALLDRTKSGSDYYRHQCGGALIHARLVLTAAHCVTNDGSRIAASNLEVVLGKRRLSVAGGEHIGISRIVIHPQYNSHNLSHDLALLHLSSPSAYTPAPLAHPSMTVYQGHVVTAMGWGKVQGQGDYYSVHSDDLKAIDLAIWSDANCTAAGATTQDAVFYRGFHGDSMICAGYSNSSETTCNGDSGSPMMIPDAAGTWRLLGMVSWGGIGCPGGWSPSVFAWTQGPAMYSFITQGIAEAGQAPQPGSPSASPTGLTLSGVRLSRTRVRAGRRLVVGFNTTAGGTVSLRISRAGRSLGAWTARVSAGGNRVSLVTRNGGRRFRRGNYRMVVQVTSGGVRSNPVLLGFRVVR